MANPESRRITRTMSATQLVALLLAFLLAAGAGGVLAAGLVVPLVAAANVAANSTVQIFDEVPDELEPGPLSQQSRIYASDGTLLATFYAQNRIVVPLENVSEHMKNAVVAIEDERFWEHGGVDVRGISRALANNLGSGNSTQGASTLTQQYVKNVLIEQALLEGDPFGVLDAREDSMARKLREAKLAIALEKRMSKEEILQGYLNVAQFGSRSIYGVETAAQYYFSKSSADLTPVEAATIAGVTKAPSAFDPTVDPERAEQRRNLVLDKMWQQGYLSTADYEAAKATPLEDTLKVKPIEVGCHAAGGAAFFCDYVTKEIVLSPAFGETRAEREALLYRGGLEIHTTLDMNKQRAAEKAITEAVPADDGSHLEAAIVSVEPGTGQIKAMAQNVPYSDPQNTESTRQTTINYSADFLHGASRGLQPGSNFKPIVLAHWLKEGHTLRETVNANKVPRWPQDFNAPCTRLVSNEPWEPANAEGNEGGRMSVLEATYKSVNTAYASMGFELNLCDLRETAWNMGFRPTSSGVQGKVLPNPELTDVDVQAPMVIGTQETSPLNMASIYATIASGGTYCDPIAITKVTGPDGTEYEVPGQSCNPDALPENIANTVTYAMEQVFTNGTARRLGGLADGRPVAGKTGTSQLSAQTWFTGFTPNLSTSVWVGSIESATEDHTEGITVNGRYYEPLYGSSVAAPAWKAYMDVAVADLPVQGFGPPDPKLIGIAPAPPPPPAPAAPPSNPNPGNQGGGGDDGGGGDGGDGGGDGGDGGGDGDGGDGGPGNGNGNGGNAGDGGDD